MKTSTLAGLIGLTTLAAAAPANHIRRANDLGHQVKAPINARQAYPTGTAIYPTGTAPPVPISTGSASCPVDGAVVCNGPSYFGLCNFGSVVWQRVSDGTACVDGQIVGTGIYALPPPTGTTGSITKHEEAGRDRQNSLETPYNANDRDYEDTIDITGDMI